MRRRPPIAFAPGADMAMELLALLSPEPTLASDLSADLALGSQGEMRKLLDKLAKMGMKIHVCCAASGDGDVIFVPVGAAWEHAQMVATAYWERTYAE